MQNAIEDICHAITEIRHLLGPIDVKLDKLEHKVTANCASLELKTFELEAKLAVHALRISEQTVKYHEHATQIASLFEQVKWIEGFMKIPKRPEKESGGESGK